MQPFTPSFNSHLRLSPFISYYHISVVMSSMWIVGNVFSVMRPVTGSTGAVFILCSRLFSLSTIVIDNFLLYPLYITLSWVRFTIRIVSRFFGACLYRGSIGSKILILFHCFKNTKTAITHIITIIETNTISSG